jgi:hypothetical protein
MQGKQCLKYKSDTEYRVIDIPIVLPQENRKEIQYNLFFLGDILLGEATYKTIGYEAQSNISVIQNAGYKKQEGYNYLFTIGNNKFKLVTVSQEFMSRDSGFKAKYEFSIPNYITTTKDEVYINLNFEKELANEKWDEKYNFPLEFKYLKENLFTTVIDIPAHYKLEYVPENFEIDNEIFSAGFIYEVKDNAVHFKKYLTLKKLIIPIELFDIYNETVDHICKMYKQCIVLKMS